MDNKEYATLLDARRLLDILAEDCIIVGDIRPVGERWELILKLRNKGDITEDIPKFTTWYVIIEQGYPNGEIRFYPAKEGGIQLVYPHQSPQDISDSSNYHKSNLCLEQYSPSLIEKTHDIYKLYNYVLKSLEWIEAAASNTLLKECDFFEIVSYPFENYYNQVIFSESSNSFNEWKKSEFDVGFCNLKRIKNFNQNYYYLNEFYGGPFSYKKADKLLSEINWGNYVTADKTEEKKGVWIKLDSMPKIEPWGAPQTWGQLLEIIKENKKDLIEELFSLIDQLRDGLSHFMIIGFPIPKLMGKPASEYYWQAMELPVLAYPKSNPAFFKGFRNINQNYKYIDQMHILKSNMALKWIKSENWSSDNITSRGNMSNEIKKLDILLIGSGTLGSELSESLVRLGVNRIDIVDSDVIQTGNLTRHKLLMEDLYQSKAKQMSARLSKSNIHYTGSGYFMELNEFFVKFPEKISEYDVIIETTGSTEVLETLSKLSEEILIYSISIGLNAQRLYLYSGKSKDISVDFLSRNIEKYLVLDLENFPEENLPRDGLGCWHPLFPARIDHISALCSVAINIIESDVTNNQNSLTVVERGELGTTRIVMRKFIDESSHTNEGEK